MGFPAGRDRNEFNGGLLDRTFLAEFPGLLVPNSFGTRRIQDCRTGLGAVGPGHGLVVGLLDSPVLDVSPQNLSADLNNMLSQGSF